MTTIAYRDGVMAADSIVTGGSTRVATTHKMFRSKGGDLVGVSGHIYVLGPFERWAKVDNCSPSKLPNLTEDDYCALWVKADGTTFFIERGHAVQVYGKYLAVGSGDELAMGAMAAGADPETAVMIAATHDTGTLGPVFVERLAPLTTDDKKEPVADNVISFPRK